MGTITACRHDGEKTPVSQMLLKTCRTDSDVSGLTVDNGFRPPQWLTRLRQNDFGFWGR